MILGSIYCITNTINSKVYVGKTLLPIQKRFQQHLQDAKRFIDRPLYRAINKYGAIFLFFFVMLYLTPLELHLMRCGG